MKILVLQPDDQLDSRLGERWDLVVDLARAPRSTYEMQRRQHGRPVVSIYDFAREVEDLHLLRYVLQPGMGQITDQWGIDWWDVLSLMVSPQLQQIVLLRRLASEIGPNCQIHTSRSEVLGRSLALFSGSQMFVSNSRIENALQKLRRNRQAISRLDVPKVAQVLQDKFDREHRIRRLLARREVSEEKDQILLPSAYVNVSRTSVEMAKLLPDLNFLLVYARRSGRLRTLPANVRMISLDGFFRNRGVSECKSLKMKWASLVSKFAGSSEEMSIAVKAGLLEQVWSLMPWGIAMRDAWNRLFDMESIAACLCADDSNPYSRIPLILASHRGMPTLACHHGALDFRMAIKTQYADHYLVKSEMEGDYLIRQCKIPSQRLVAAGSETVVESLQEQSDAIPARPWLVFFSESYETSGWRSAEIYRDLLPRLAALADACKLQLVLKLHPFESAKAFKRLLQEYLPKALASRVLVVEGALDADSWKRIRFAVTVQSTVALECGRIGIPVFLCAWLGDSFSGYVSQFSRFNVGHVLKSPEQIASIPQFLETKAISHRSWKGHFYPVDSERLRDLVLRQHPLPAAINE